MSQFIVDSSFWNLFPQAKLGVVLLKDYTLNDDYQLELTNLLKESNEKALQHLTEETFSENDVIQIYRKAFQQFKTKKGARSSIESLLKRVSNGKPVSNINPLVDIYNAASLQFALPVGAEDSDTFEGDLQLTITEGGDDFFLIGEDDNKPTLPGELCYRDDNGAVCRCLNWRDGDRTMITEKTKNAFLIIEALDPSQFESLEKALNFIEEKSKQYLGAKTQQFILDKEHTTITI
ncbi:hypothetical protein HMPREF9318_00869 [Streptococcus urinalis FB127-CNA-2]|uniref:B3/4 domain protein n=1 Tax=Streptococcus urinalis 2285-97 TaxID=764291 RepID=G5KGC6_9STRE|nr:B3/4 domain-containing protein [Streptococcus urinalis]EHJ55966.1 B3/4 domain protein [Streptococcus urinalis 2285-97]EKS20915.1 hypothetical protein HMPREF9318_00869 [Streptococcus urinalis FB127-CNA-2]VEF33127.1 Putative uncharacterized protein gbs2121 [Streptococcus urinalis]